MLDLYERVWEEKLPKDEEFVLSADEKSSIQASARICLTQTHQPGSPMKAEHEYKRCGAWAYLATRDVHRAKVFGRCEPSSGIAPLTVLWLKS